MPDLFFISNGQAFTIICVAVFISKFTHQFYRIPGIGAPLKGDALQFLDHEKPIIIDQFPFASNGGFSNGKLFLIHGGITDIEVGVGLFHLRNFTLFNQVSYIPGGFRMHGPPVYFPHGARFMFLMRDNVQPGAVGTITTVTGHDGSIR